MVEGLELSRADARGGDGEPGLHLVLQSPGLYLYLKVSVHDRKHITYLFQTSPRPCARYSVVVEVAEEVRSYVSDFCFQPSDRH